MTFCLTKSATNARIQLLWATISFLITRKTSMTYMFQQKIILKLNLYALKCLKRFNKKR